MSNDNGKISVRQVFLLFIVLFCTPSIRFTPLYATEIAKQAGWLAPFITCIFMVIYVLIWCSFLKRYSQKSFVEIINDIIGKVFGSILCSIYFIWITLDIVYNVRMYIQRIIGTTMPNVSSIVLASVMLLIVGYVIKNGIIPISKMNEIFFLVLTGIFILYNILILPEIHVNNLFPITYKDFWPVFKANFGQLAVFSYVIILFMFNDKVDHKGEFKRIGLKTIIILTIISLVVIIIPLCVFGPSILVKMPIPFISTMMQISLFDVIQRVESGIVMFWGITDFVLISVFIYAAIHMLRVYFKLSNVRPLTNIYIVFILFLSMALAQSSLELKVMSSSIIVPLNIIMGYIIPIILFCIAKVRKKI